MEQISIFSLLEDMSETKWEDVDNLWLLRYGADNYPEMEFAIDGNAVKSHSTKRSAVEMRAQYLHKWDTDEVYRSIWANPFLVHLGWSRNYGDFEGEGLAVCNFDEFKKALDRMVSKETKEMKKGFSQ